jgi:penicillin-binding protein 1A
LRISTIFDATGDVAKEIAEERRVPIEYDKFPKYLIEAVVAAEDMRFFEHKGLDYFGILRAFWRNIWRSKGSPLQGGSTITQQVVRTFLLSLRQTYSRKFKEVILAYRLERNLSKQEILYLYLNQIYLGRGCYGVEAASRYYFGKSVTQVDLSQMAILAGIPKHPERYNPANSLRDTRRRRNYVLRRMYENGFIDAKLYNRELSKPIEPPPPHNDPPFQQDDYTKEAHIQTAAILEHAIASQSVAQPKRPQIVRKRIEREGLYIDTGLHAATQKLTKTVLQRGLHRLADKRNFALQKLKGAAVAIDPRTHRVRALVHNRDWAEKGQRWAIDASRQMGNLLQPLIYAAAIESKLYTAATLMPAVLPWSTSSANTNNGLQHPQSKSLGALRLREALLQANDAVALRLVLGLGVSQARTSLEHLGLFEPVLQPSSMELYVPSLKSNRATVLSGDPSKDQKLSGDLSKDQKLSEYIKDLCMIAYQLSPTAPDIFSQTSIEPCQHTLSLSIGQRGVSLLHLTNAYAALAAHGVYDEPVIVTRIRSHSGEILYERLPDPRRRIDAGAAYITMLALQDGLKRAAPEQLARFSQPIAGIGSSHPLSHDAWFIGCIPDICVGIWVGTSSVNKESLDDETGYSAVLPIFIDWMTQYVQLSWEATGHVATQFSVPEGIVFARIDPDTGKLALPQQNHFVSEAFLKHTQPKQHAHNLSKSLEPEDFYLSP